MFSFVRPMNAKIATYLSSISLKVSGHLLQNLARNINNQHARAENDAVSKIREQNYKEQRRS
jgi:hypothetical protein